MTASEAHTVSWEQGDQKPANPMTMSKARRWLIVAIVSSGSLCVQVPQPWATAYRINIEQGLHIIALRQCTRELTD